ncbi:hypothetical protein QAD02_006201 [Eretmocerus hayati]|uniref:Uncharacterized protein n=1 Tax=Eretmocerus hayati TaxID=131215 RepID=A0ACC2N0C4_9HYME|nr:hypothetical protein QAD02_006201 [Eretmocerus hayati]
MAFTTFLIHLAVLCTALKNLHGEPLAGVAVAKVEENEFNAAASIVYLDPTSPVNDRHFCSGTLISPKHILTSHHCTIKKNPKNIAIFLGSPDVKWHRQYHADKIIAYNFWFHKKYNKLQDLDIYDASIITLKEEVNPEDVKPVTIRYDSYENLKESGAVVMGWSSPQSDKKLEELKKASVTFINEKECQKLTVLKFPGEKKILCSIATPPVGIKVDDRGGPLLDLKKRLIGINLAVSLTKQGNPDYVVHVHSNVRYFQEFINEIINSP